MAKENINEFEYYQLMGLKALADECSQRLDHLVEAANKITGDEDWSHTSDWMYGGKETAEALLKKLKISIYGKGQPKQEETNVKE